MVEKAYEVETEVDVSAGLPQGWTGSADIILTARSDNSRWLVDLKTVASIQLYMADKQLERVQQQSNKDNSWPSVQYVWQISAYYWALKKMGQEVDRVAILFWPVDTYYDRAGRKHALSPRAVEIIPVSEEEVLDRMKLVSSSIAEWQSAKESTGKTINFNLPEHLEPEQKLVPKPSAKNPERYEVHQKLDWRCRYCPFFAISCDPPFEDEHIGTYFFENGTWIYREEIPGTKPLVRP